MNPPPDVNHTFSDAELEELIAFGAVESHAAGALILAEGTMAPDCIVTLSGHTDIFVQTDDGNLLTPALACGLLPGVLRAELLETGKAREAVLEPDDLVDAPALFVGNSLRGLIPAKLGGGNSD